MTEEDAAAFGQCIVDERPDMAPGAPWCHLSPDDLARRWRRSPRTLERWRQARKGPAWLRLHGRVLYRLEDVLAYEQGCLERPSE